jgi:hypothetical protein
MVHFGVPSPEQASRCRSALLEFVMTFPLVPRCGAAVDERGPKVGGFAINLTVFMDIWSAAAHRRGHEPCPGVGGLRLGRVDGPLDLLGRPVLRLRRRICHSMMKSR